VSEAGQEERVTAGPDSSRFLPTPVEESPPGAPPRRSTVWQRAYRAVFRFLKTLRAAQRELRKAPERNAVSPSKIARTTAFKLSLAYLVIFAIGSAFVLGGVAWNVNGLLNEQITQTIQAEITGLAEQYEVGGIRQLVESIDRRTRLPGSSLYLVANYSGETITGNVGSLPPGVIERTGLVQTPYSKPNETKLTHLALARIFQLQGGFRLLVGRDLDERENLRHVMVHALVTSLLWLIAIGVAGGLFVAWRVLRRVDAMTATARTIMATGDMTRRLPIAGTGDELDRLAANLNAMIARIATLMAGMKEVSDNIAHDLRTPLTRLRNGAEDALRHEQDGPGYRAALGKVIEESDGLIGIFNALLMIARAEAGSGREGMSGFDAAGVARDVAELYEAVAEDRGVDLQLRVDGELMVHGSRELLGQALANLVDNAFKYGLPDRSENEADAPRSSPDIEILAVRDGTAALIGVGDHGVGIPDEDRGRVLGRFVRLESARSRPGSGLGLSLAAAIAQLHGGTIEVADNRPGLRITLRLPLVRAKALAPPTQAPAEATP
jgi:signal transduction histidine kinase